MSIYSVQKDQIVFGLSIGCQLFRTTLGSLLGLLIHFLNDKILSCTSIYFTKTLSLINSISMRIGWLKINIASIPSKNITSCKMHARILFGHGKNLFANNFLYESHPNHPNNRYYVKFSWLLQWLLIFQIAFCSIM